MKIANFIIAFTALCLSANGATLSIVNAWGHNEKDNFGGNLLDVYNGSGMNGVVHPADQSTWPPATDPSTWTNDSSAYRDEWQAQAGLTGAINDKLGWVVIDLGDVYNLESLHVWHIRENSGRVAGDYDIYVANAALNLVHGPTNSTAVDYSFSGANGWTATTLTGLAGTHRGKSVHDLSAYDARFIGIEILDNTSTDVKVGFSEFGVTGTAVPEATTTLLGSFGLLMLLRRRR